MHKQINLVIVGRGNMANLFAGSDIMHVAKKSTIGVTFPVDPEGLFAETDNHTVFVHVGSGRLILEVLRHCIPRDIPIIQASSSMELDGHKFIIPSETWARVINAPNLAIPIIALFRSLKHLTNDLTQTVKIENTSVVESHQSTKTTTPSTAKKFAQITGVGVGEIDSIRSPVIQKVLLGVPPKHLDGHAYHIITITVGGMEIEIKTKVNGRDAYIPGLEAILAKIIDSNGVVPQGVHQIEDFLFN